MGRAAQVLGEPRCKGSPGGAVACIEQRWELLQEAINTHSAREAHRSRVRMRSGGDAACSNSTARTPAARPAPMVRVGLIVRGLISRRHTGGSDSVTNVLD